MKKLFSILIVLSCVSCYSYKSVSYNKEIPNLDPNQNLQSFCGKEFYICYKN